MGVIRLEGRLVCNTPAEAAAVRRSLPDHIALTRAEEGCLAFDVAETGDPLVWSVAEAFASRAAFGEHQARMRDSAWAHATAGIERDYILNDEQ